MEIDQLFQESEEIELKNILEIVLFLTDHAVTLPEMKRILGKDVQAQLLKGALTRLKLQYNPQNGVVLYEVGQGYQFRTNPQYKDLVKKYMGIKPRRFSKQLLECLAIIAYNQPITRAGIENLRGIDSGGLLKQLLERELICISGKSDLPGKPAIYATTRKFLEYFSLKDLSELPNPKEISALNEKALAIVDGYELLETERYKGVKANGRTNTEDSQQYWDDVSAGGGEADQ